MNHEELTQQIENFAAIATRGCGQSDVVWGTLFQNSFDGWVSSLSAEDKESAIEIAKQQGYYCGEEDEDDLGSDYCCHGLTADTCPCGCFEDSTEADEDNLDELLAAQEAEYYAQEQVDWVRV